MVVVVAGRVGMVRVVVEVLVAEMVVLRGVLAREVGQRRLMLLDVMICQVDASG